MDPATRKRLGHAFLAFSIVATATSIWLWVPFDVLALRLGPLPDTVAEQVQAAPGAGIDGITVYIERPGRPAELFHAGWKDRAARIPADPKALHKIGSITKLYVAAAVAKLVADGTLDLDRTLAQYLPAVADDIQYADEITLRMLVGHRSGIPNYSDFPAFDWGAPEAGERDALAIVADQPAEFRPGAEYRYSNTNYRIIGDIIDTTLGYGWQDYVRAEILEPLSLERTYFSNDEIDLDELAGGYVVGYDGDAKALRFTGPAGCMISTLEDTGTFLRALVDGTLLSEREQAIYEEIYVLGHTGLLTGYSSHAFHHEHIDAVVVQFVNTSGGTSWGVTDALYDRIVRILSTEA